MKWTTVCKRDQVQEDFPFSAKVDDKEVGIYLLDGEYFALEDVCPHAYALLSQGFVEDGMVECPLHEAAFDIRTGKCLREPGERDLDVYPVRIVDDHVQLNMNEQGA
ncbi:MULTISPECIES: non-heme iron oxygenase ferredoxin subunit [Chromohalobacter]|jgi:NAD(P)H-dependent nitrite reductase small subunit|uniref:Rieske (2Fe-2S) protein n=1 Tax=Chromohalobacter israelensis (strain ATCC BAA-138 / DSM 3043 / CIP 106854 / NCIMB 13768 / 1H11) TaxID=290398 RepID=Q1R1B4_CHRI1|nr:MULTISPECIES: non-heme iron oxygenase ferredoxin subunit [Chromohalobacter]ABE57494.1 Rieske (2Fe-2S) protein [Chromohalobacter salexigens DSM 3043]MBZ5876393.1 non-heme iron oxygenase ferredoxin subunit [Chromohalobacter salexigens]MDO0945369.1 non-heme iron oxygenase ferredoxin subunit [Chromohalobacter salexigens]NQY45474.1 non-heme iron oxygenase ferredoxin subunit [Chromohalobacter sp.]RXE46687.1 naphthalene 1,2-dioxygenase [Chromohalobacter salexigens]